MKAYPWLREEDLPGSSGARAKRRKVAMAGGDGAAIDCEEEVAKGGVEEEPADAGDFEEEAEAEEVVGEGELDIKDESDTRHELEMERAEWSWEWQADMNFYTRVLGGEWTRRERGVVSDCVSGFCRGWVLDWCRAFGWPPSARFGFARFGRGPAHQLCREWCRRAEFFYRIWVEAESEEFVFTALHINSYEEDMEWLDFMIGLPASDPAFAKGMEMRGSAPRVGPAIAV